MNKITICMYSDENGVNSAQSKTVVLYKTEEEAKQMFWTSLERTGAGYFDFYLLHALGADGIKKLEQIGGFEFIQKLKAEGKVKHAGFSFHDSAKVLDETLTYTSMGSSSTLQSDPRPFPAYSRRSL